MRVCAVRMSVLGSGRGLITVQDGENFHFVKFVADGDDVTFDSLYNVVVPHGVIEFCSNFFASSRKFLGV